MEFYKNKSSDKICWLDNPDVVGEWIFTFDKKRLFNLFGDYSYGLSEVERAILMRKILFGKIFLRIVFDWGCVYGVFCV